MITTIISRIQGVSSELLHHESRRIIFPLSYACSFADLTMFWNCSDFFRKIENKRDLSRAKCCLGEGWTSLSDFWSIRSKFHKTDQQCSERHKLDFDLRVEKYVTHINTSSSWHQVWAQKLGRTGLDQYLGESLRECQFFLLGRQKTIHTQNLGVPISFQIRTCRILD